MFSVEPMNFLEKHRLLVLRRSTYWKSVLEFHSLLCKHLVLEVVTSAQNGCPKRLWMSTQNCGCKNYEIKTTSCTICAYRFCRNRSLK